MSEHEHSGLFILTVPFHAAMLVIACTAAALGIWPLLALPVGGSCFVVWMMWMLDDEKQRARDARKGR